MIVINSNCFKTFAITVLYCEQFIWLLLTFIVSKHLQLLYTLLWAIYMIVINFYCFKTSEITALYCEQFMYMIVINFYCFKTSAITVLYCEQCILYVQFFCSYTFIKPKHIFLLLFKTKYLSNQITTCSVKYTR